MGIFHIELLFPGDQVYVDDPIVIPDPLATQSLFTDQIPALINQQDSTYTLGTLFSSDIDGSIIGIRAYVGEVPTSPDPKGLLYEWLSNTTGTLLAEMFFGELIAGEWNEILFDTPVAITAGTTYVAAWGPTNNYSASSAFFDSALVNLHLTGLQNQAGRLNGKFHVGTSFTYPDGSSNAGCYFVDPIFEYSE